MNMLKNAVCSLNLTVQNSQVMNVGSFTMK